MAEIPQIPPQPTRDAIWAAYQAEPRREDSRRIPVSKCGAACARAMWLSFRWASPPEQHSGRMLRLFSTGHHEERRVFADLLMIGCTVVPGPGWQIQLPAGQRTHVAAFEALAPYYAQLEPPQLPLQHPESGVNGYADGAVLGLPEAPATWHLLEIKTHSVRSFEALRKNGLAHAKPEHVAQCQVGMHLLGLERCLYIAVCKDTDDLETVRLKYDKQTAEGLLARARAVYTAAAPPVGYTDPFRSPCSYCHHADICHTQADPPRVNCRTCVWSRPGFESWHCEKHNRELDPQAQAVGCPGHMWLPELLAPRHKLRDATAEYVEYEDTTTRDIWRNGPAGEASERVKWLPF